MHSDPVCCGMIFLGCIRSFILLFRCSSGGRTGCDEIPQTSIKPHGNQRVPVVNGVRNLDSRQTQIELCAKSAQQTVYGAGWSTPALEGEVVAPNQ